MPEHTIPTSLLDNIERGRAALVVGAGIGVPSWKQLLERMNQELRDRGEATAKAARDVDRLLHKGSLVRAAGFLARQLGEEVCDRIVAEVWSSPAELSPIAAAIARLPLRQVWSTFPGDVLERAMEADLPDDWPAPRVFTYRRAAELDLRRRTVLKVLGDYDSFVATPRSVRKALAGAADLREHLRPFYTEGSLLFVGFRYGDPDLAALLDRIFGAFEPPMSDHYLLAAGLGPVTVDELAAEHHIQVLELPGKGADDTANQALVELLGQLRAACDERGITLAQIRPAADDLEGWLARLADDAGDEEALAALAAIEAAARAGGDAERLIEVLLARVEFEGTGVERARLLCDVARVYESELGDVPRAFTALTAALREDPADETAVDAAERLADAADGWAELVGDVSAIATEMEDDELAAAYWARLGRWYHKKLDHVEYAVAAFREAARRDARSLEAVRGLAELYRSQQRWGELADVLARQVELEEDGAGKLDASLALGDLFETQLASTARAIEAYEAAAAQQDSDDALVALERLYRRDERWGKLAAVLETRAERFEAAGDADRAGALRAELATLRADRLGDVRGAVERHEAALARDPGDVAALAALADLYEKVGKGDDYLRTLERLAKACPDGDRPVHLRRLAAALEERPGEAARAVAAWEQLLASEPGAADALAAIERLLSDAGRTDDLLAHLERRVVATRAAADRAELCARIGAICERELADPHRAAAAYQRALAEVPEHRPSLAALPELLVRIEAWRDAVEVLVRRARLGGQGGAADWCRAGRLCADALGDTEAAQEHLEKALELDPTRLETLLALVEVHREQKAWVNAVRRLELAAEASQNRLDKIDHLLEAADIAETRLEHHTRAAALLEQILELDPEHLEVGARVADKLLAAGRDADAVPVLEMLARRSEGDRLEHARRETELGGALFRTGRFDDAASHFGRALDADPAAVGAGLGLAAALFELATETGDSATWKRLDGHCRDLLARHRAALADGQVAQLWHRIGVAARHLGDDKRATDALRRALEREPGHEPSLLALVEVAEAAGEWKAAIAARRELLERAEGDARAAMLEEIGDLYQQKLADPAAALGAYLEALSARPDSHVLLHKSLDIYTEQKEWRPAVETLAAIARTESDPRRRAKYHYAAAVIGRDELGDVELAVERFNAALDDDPATPKAFEALEQLLEGRGDWKNLARAYRRMLKRQGEDAPAELLLHLWTRLGEVCAEHLGDTEAAIAAFEVATSLAPDDSARHEQLADLYLEAGEPHRADAVAELQLLLQTDPDRVEIYRALSELYRADGQADKAFCVAQALVFLGAATDAERALFERHRPAQLVLASRRLTEELWQKAIASEREDRHIGAIFAAVAGAVAATTARPPEAFAIAPDAGGDGSAAARVFEYAAGVLGLSPEPSLALAPELDGLRVANTARGGKLVPTVVVGSPHADKSDERELAFEIGKRLAYLRPERYLHYALQTQPRVEAAFYAALLASGVEVGGEHEGAEELAEHLRRSVPAPVLEHVGAVASRLGSGDGKNGVITGWRTATDLTANRVGFVLCNDLETAARLIATEASAPSTLSAVERLRDLVAYSASEHYFAVRRHLGLATA